MSEQKIERHRLSTLSLQSISFAKKLANTSWLCMLETSVLRKLLEDNEAQKLHWFRKMNWNRKLIMLDAKFCRWNSRIFKRFLSLEYPSIHYCISREHSDFSSSTVQALILLSGYDGSACVGLIAQPVAAIFLLSLVFKHSNLCRFAILASSVIKYLLCLASLSTMTDVVSVPSHTVRAYTVSRDILWN